MVLSVNETEHGLSRSTIEEVILGIAFHLLIYQSANNRIVLLLTTAKNVTPIVLLLT